ncbi:Protochlorophyllide-dependent translocon component 52, chloroplastic [Linum grandiflorum]
MELAFRTSAFLPSRHIRNPLLHLKFSNPNLNLIHTKNPSKFKLFSASSSVSVDHNNDHVPVVQPESVAEENGKFDWYAQWYPLTPECDLDKRVPHARKVLGIDVVAWWDKNDNSWKVFDDMCPHRLAPLSEGRIDQSGRLQCVYHGWCFDGSGSCKLIPQAPTDGPPVHTNKRACVATTYPTIVHHDILWFWPNSDPQYRNIFEKKKPPFLPELDDPSFTKVLGIRDFPYGYEVLMENLMDPAHVPYSHSGLVLTHPPKVKVDKEGGRPLDFTVNEIRMDGYDANVDYGYGKFAAPCVFSIHAHDMAIVTKKTPGRTAFIFMCIPVSPGNTRLIWCFPRNFDIWIDKIVPRWFVHLGLNLVFDSDLNLLHVEEQRIKGIGGNPNWQKACFVPTKSDALVVGFRRWLTQYGGGEIDWRGKYAADHLPPTPPREQLLDRYWSHVVNCSSCNDAFKKFKALETFLLALSVGLIAVAAATKEGMMFASSRTRMAIVATICFAASRWLARFVYTSFRYHDYNHTSPPTSNFSLSKLVGIAV